MSQVNGGSAHAARAKMRYHQKLANLVIESDDEEEDSLDLELSSEEDSDTEQDPR